jgi:exodeoxyribonuclease VII large subunit
VVKDGERVLCRGRIDVYEKRGEYQLIVSDILASGERGLAYLRFLSLRRGSSKRAFLTRRSRNPFPGFPGVSG